MDKEGCRPEQVDMGTVDRVHHGWTRIQGRTCDRQRQCEVVTMQYTGIQWVRTGAVVKAFLSASKAEWHSSEKFQGVPLQVICISGTVILEYL